MRNTTFAFLSRCLALMRNPASSVPFTKQSRFFRQRVAWPRSLQICIVTLATFVGTAFPVSAVSFLVSNINDSGSGSLRQAILNANAAAGPDTITFSDGTGGTVDFHGTAQTILLTSGQLQISEGLDITAPPVGLTLDAGSSSRVIDITGAGFTVTLDSLTITNGDAGSEEGGGIWSEEASLTVTNCVITGNSANFGGGIFHGESSSSRTAGALMISNTTLADNGGSTLTHALVPGSPAIDMGDNAFALDADGVTLLFDQRGTGFPRFAEGTVDIGAFELPNLAPELAFVGGVALFGDWMQLGDPLLGEEAFDLFGVDVAMDDAGDTVLIGGPIHDSNNGHAKIYDLISGAWVQRGDEIAGLEGGSFGGELDLSGDGDTAIFGSRVDGGPVRLYGWNETAWEQRGGDVTPPWVNDNHEEIVAISADGQRFAMGIASGAGEVAVYQWSATTMDWEILGAPLVGGEAGAIFGAALALNSDGTAIAVGAPGSNRCHILDWDGSTWVQRGDPIPGETAGENAPSAVAMSADGATVVLGSTGNSDAAAFAGQVRVFDWDAGAMSWVQRGADLEGTAQSNTGFGTGVAISADGNQVFAVGRRFGSGMNSGYAQAFQWDPDAMDWQQVGERVFSPGTGDRFGNAIGASADGRRIVVGAPEGAANGNDSGEARAFEISVMGRTYTIPENTTAITDIGASDDRDTEGDGLTYTMTPNPEATTDIDEFVIDENTGVLAFVTPRDFENPTDSWLDNAYKVNVVVTDSGGLSETRVVMVNITDVEETATVGIAVSSSTAIEGDNVTFTITRDLTVGDLEVGFTLGGAAMSGDYTLDTTSPVTIPDGQASVTITLSAVSDDATAGAELAENVELTLTPSSEYDIDEDNDSATVEIEASGTHVTNTDDAGEGSLRQAILNANAIAGADTITFSDGAGGTVDFHGTHQTIAVGDEMTISTAIEIPAPSVGLTLDGEGDQRIFLVSGREVANLSRMAIVNGAPTDGDGGGILVTDDSVVRLTDCTLSNHKRSAISTEWGVTSEKEIVLTRCLLENNSGADGGAIFSGDCKLVVEDCIIRNNTANKSGGGIYCKRHYSGTADISGTLITGNTARTVRGGGFYIRDGIRATLVNTTISGNSALGEDSDIAGGGNGGGIYVGSSFAANRLILHNVTVTDNTAAGKGGGIDFNRGNPPGGADNLTFRNTIIAGNSAGVSHPDGHDNDSSGYTLNLDRNNLLGGTADDPLVPGASDLSLEELGLTIGDVLAPLADNGGPTQTHALVVGSPAIDAGSDAGVPDGTEFDQRGAGFPRISGYAVDIGAYERPGTLVTNTGDAGEGSLRQAVLNADTLPGADVITFSDGSGGTTDFHTEPQTITLLSALDFSSEIDITAPASSSLTIDVSAAGAAPINISGRPVILRDLTLRGGDGSVEVWSSLDAFRCTFTGFSSSNYGAVHCRAGSGNARFYNCTFSANPGGAVDVGHEVRATLVNCTVTGNGGRAINLDYAGKLTLENSIVAGNGNSGSASPDIYSRSFANPDSGFGEGPVLSANNVIGVDGNGWFPNVPTFASTGTTLADLLDVTLQNNGGPTQTHALVVGSLMIDAGSSAKAVGPDSDSLMTDQRGAGFPRISGEAVDIGAYELLYLGGPSLVVPASATAAKETATAISGISVSDPDPDTVTLTFTATNGTLAIGGQSGTSVTLTDTPENLNTLLSGADGLKFTGLLNVVGTDVASIAVTVDDLVAEPVSKTIPVTISGSSYDHWRFASFPFDDVTDSTKQNTVWGDSATPSNDIFPNLFKFVHGLETQVQTLDLQVELGTVTVTEGTDETYVTYTFKQRKDIGGAALTCEVSGAPGTLAPLPAGQRMAVDIPGEPDFELVTWLDTVPITASAPRYGRLVASATDHARSETFVTTSFDLRGPSGSDTQHYNFVSMTSLRQLRFAGAVDDKSETTLTCAVGDWASGAFTDTPHYVILVTGDASGTTADIVSHNGDTLTLSDPIGMVASLGDAFEIRPHATVDSIFGATNDSGLNSGANASDADNLLLPEPGGAIRRFFYSDLEALSGWLSQTYDRAGESVIHPEQGLIVARKVAQDLSLYFQGAVRKSDLNAPIEEGFNLVGTAVANEDLRLDLLESIGSLYTGDPVTGLASGANATDADTLWVIDPENGAIVRYFHNGSGWLDAQFNSADNVELQPGAAIYINRKARAGVSAEDNAFSWKIPPFID